MVAAAAIGKRIGEPGDWLWSYWWGVGDNKSLYYM